MMVDDGAPHPSNSDIGHIRTLIYRCCSSHSSSLWACHYWTDGLHLV